MKRLLLFELLLIFLATTFESDSPPGWYQQVLPRADVLLSDIFFIDTLTGWTIGRKNTNDTAFVFNTTDGGINWAEQYKALAIFSEVQFLDVNTGYIAGDIGFGAIFKTTNSGINWNLILNSGDGYQNLYFVNADTGWISDANATFGAGLQKTTNGGTSWVQQLNRTFRPSKLFFINKDTGWVACNSTELYRTTNGGTDWNLQFTFSTGVGDIAFLNSSFGLVTSGINQRTTDGGFSWTPSLNSATGIKLSIVSDSIAYAGLNFIYVVKTTNGGISWFNQSSPINNNQAVSAVDSLAWAGGNGIVHTTDGGGPPVGITQINNEIPREYKLYQNYPNPFNPVTNIKYSVKRQTSNVKIVIFDIQGKEISELVNQKQNTGTYLVDWPARTGGNAVGYSSGVYFYSLIVEGQIIDTKKMLMIK